MWVMSKDHTRGNTRYDGSVSEACYIILRRRYRGVFLSVSRGGVLR
jgi:hypothetical protein